MRTTKRPPNGDRFVATILMSRSDFGKRDLPDDVTA